MSDLDPIKEIGEERLLPADTTLKSITDAVSRVTETKAPLGWWIVFLSAASLAGLLGVAIGYLAWTGIGTWGNNSPVAWAWDITNFVWWIGIGHAGTLISAVLFLFRQKWRTSINRFAEAMTIFAVICA
ncbi:MAG TPA: hydrogenase, partial [Polyangiales bacterium]